MQRSDTLAQIQSTIDYVMNALTLPDYINPEDVEQQTALIHLELLSGKEEFPTVEDLHHRVLCAIREWLTPAILNHGDRVSLNEYRNNENRRQYQQALREIEINMIRRECLTRIVDTLSPRCKYVVEQHLGLNSEPKTLEQIAREFGISRSRVKAIERNAMWEMRKLATAMAFDA